MLLEGSVHSSLHSGQAVHGVGLDLEALKIVELFGQERATASAWQPSQVAPFRRDGPVSGAWHLLAAELAMNPLELERMCKLRAAHDARAVGSRDEEIVTTRTFRSGTPAPPHRHRCKA